MAFGRVRLYHYNNRAGKVFDNEADYVAHLADGWVDFPTKIEEPGSVPVEAEAAPEPAPEPTPDPPMVPLPVKAKKPGRQPKKFKGGK